MLSHTLDMYIVPSTDEHLNEYVPLHYRRLAALTGFNGSAGTVIVCQEGMHQLFVDSRYHIQAEQSCGAEFYIHKMGNKGVPKPHAWFENCEKKELRVGVDPFLMSVKQYGKYETALQALGHTLVPVNPNLVDSIWNNRPEPSQESIFALNPKFIGESTQSKLEHVRTAMQKEKVSAFLSSTLDEIAWLTNLRGKDIPNTPVFEAHVVVLQEQAFCFVHHPQLLQKLLDQSDRTQKLWQCRPYSEYESILKKIASEQQRVWLDVDRTSRGVWSCFEKSLLCEKRSPVQMLKAVKNSVEIKSMQEAHAHAACAKIRSFIQLFNAIGHQQKVSEHTYAEWLEEEYKKEANFVDLSFPSIVACAEHGAIVHYTDHDSEKPFNSGDLLLIDSGIQCGGGTTDDTRTLVIGEATRKQRWHYTQVLRAHIHLAQQIFPEGTPGSALDAITRSSLWNAGLDYGHGTGHGVGSLLSVHEGPQHIAPVAHDVPLRPGMIVSNEPGYYEADWGGIRLENLYVVKKTPLQPKHPSSKTWLCFEALTLIPFERKLIQKNLLTTPEKKWLSEYHDRVYQEISPLLQKIAHREWLRYACE